MSKSHKYYAETNPNWLATLTSQEREEALSGEMDRKLNTQWAEEARQDRLQEKKDHDDWYGEY